MRQLGPRFLVLDDQYSVLDPSLPPGPGRGYLVRWRDGQMAPFDDQTCATIENAAGELISNRVSALAGIDRSTGATAFLVPVTVGPLVKLEVADGMPVIRTVRENRWVVTVHDAATGRILFQDARTGGGRQ